MWAAQGLAAKQGLSTDIWSIFGLVKAYERGRRGLTLAGVCAGWRWYGLSYRDFLRPPRREGRY